MRIIRGEGQGLKAGGDARPTWSLPSPQTPLPTRISKGDPLGRPFYHNFKRDQSPKPPGYLGTGVTSVAIFGEILLLALMDLAAAWASLRVAKGPTHT